LLEKITLNDSIEFDGTPSELRELIRLKKERDFRLEWIDNSTFKFVSNFSAGTLIFNYLPTEGIKGFAKLTETEYGKTKVELNTKIRVELFLFTLIFLIIIMVGLFSNESLPFWIYGLLPIGLVWFWWVYRIQEKDLFRKLKIYIETE
tara:strand:+ start:89 stop:532 length:444 start_codon:yes stop_codon:yes gene_type:complete